VRKEQIVCLRPAGTKWKLDWRPSHEKLFNIRRNVLFLRFNYLKPKFYTFYIDSLIFAIVWFVSSYVHCRDDPRKDAGCLFFIRRMDLDSNVDCSVIFKIHSEIWYEKNTALFLALFLPLFLKYILKFDMKRIQILFSFF